MSNRHIIRFYPDDPIGRKSFSLDFFEGRLWCDLWGNLVESNLNNLEAIPDTDADDDADMDRKEAFGELFKRAEKMTEGLWSDRQREAVLLRYCAGKTLDEIGEIMGITHQAVCRLIQRAIPNLWKTAAANSIFSDLLKRCRFAS